MIVTSPILQRIYDVLWASWWFVLPLALIFVFWEFWLGYIRLNFIRNIKWILLEIKIPKGVEKSPKAMEQVFTALHGTYTFGLRFLQKYWEGKLEEWLTLELVGRAGGVYFYARCPEIYRNLVESAVYSQYPDAEIQMVPEYMDLMPSILPNKKYDIWGTDFILSRESAYPIKTYPFFEEAAEEKRTDPIATIAEVVSKLKEDEMIWLQLVIRPTGDEWKKEAMAVRDALLGRKKPHKQSFLEMLFSEIVIFLRNLVFAAAEPPAWPDAEKKEEKSSPAILGMSPGEKEIVEAIENKISKISFEAILRFIYIDNRDRFTRANVSAVMGAIRQYSTLHLNSLRPDLNTMTLIRGPFKKMRLYARKRYLWDSYRYRRAPSKMPIFNVEELATIYHFPSFIVGAPKLRHVAAKKGGPPMDLPVE